MGAKSLHGLPERADVLLVGAGPIGLEMAAALKCAGVDYVHVDAGAIASTIAWYPYGTAIFSGPERLAIAGLPFSSYPHAKVTREEYLMYLRNVVAHYGLRVFTHQRVSSIESTASGFECIIEKSPFGVGGPDYAQNPSWRSAANSPRSVVLCEKVILAIGDMHAPKLLSIPGESLPHVSHFYRDPHDFCGTSTVIVGGKNGACEAAVRLYRAGADVTVCYRRPALVADRVKPWILIELEALIDEGKVRFLGPRKVVEISEEFMTVQSPDGGVQTDLLRADRVLLLTGYSQCQELFRSVGVTVGGMECRPIIDESTNESNVDGLFIIGTAVAGSNKTKTVHFIETSHKHIPRVMRALGIALESVPFAESLGSIDRPIARRES